MPELRARIRDAGGLAAAPPATALALPGGKRKPDNGAGSSKPKKPKSKALALPAPELDEEPLLALPAPTPKGKKAPEKPMHSHPIAEITDTCVVCDTYGNPLRGRNPVEIFSKPVLTEGLLEDADDTTTNLAKRPQQVEPGDELTQVIDATALRAEVLKMLAEDDGDDEELEEEE